MATATRSKESMTSETIGGIPTRTIESDGITSAPKTTISSFTRMAIESTDYVSKLRSVEPVVFFSSATDDRGRVVLDLFVDLGYVKVCGIRIRQQQGQIRIADGSLIDNFSVSLRGVPVNPLFGGYAQVHIHREERLLPNGDILTGGDFSVGNVSIHEIGLAAWMAYCSGRHAGIDHQSAGVKRLTPEELQAKIATAIAAKAERQAKRNQQIQIAEASTVTNDNIISTE